MSVKIRGYWHAITALCDARAAKNFPSPCSGNQRGAATTKGRIANA